MILEKSLTCAEKLNYRTEPKTEKIRKRPKQTKTDLLRRYGSGKEDAHGTESFAFCRSVLSDIYSLLSGNVISTAIVAVV